MPIVLPELARITKIMVAVCTYLSLGDVPILTITALPKHHDLNFWSIIERRVTLG